MVFKALVPKWPYVLLWFMIGIWNGFCWSMKLTLDSPLFALLVKARETLGGRALPRSRSHGNMFWELYVVPGFSLPFSLLHVHHKINSSPESRMMLWYFAQTQRVKKPWTEPSNTMNWNQTFPFKVISMLLFLFVLFYFIFGFWQTWLIWIYYPIWKLQ